MYFKDPYKMYYNYLVRASSMVSAINGMVNSAEVASVTFDHFQSMLDNSNWRELGYNELAFNLSPSLKEKAHVLKSNISNSLLSAVNLAVEVLLPILVKIKVKDAELEETNAKLAALVEPPRYSDNGQRSTSTEIAHYFAEKSRLSNIADQLDKELRLLIVDADNNIDKIKGLNSGIIDFSSLLAMGADFEQLLNEIDTHCGDFKITNIEYVQTTDKSKSGNYFIVTFKNGKKLYLHQQKDGTGGMWNEIDIGKEDDWNGGGGCSVFATSAAFSWLLGQYIPPREVMMAGGGQFGGIREIATNHAPININGQEYIIDAEVSETNISYANKAERENVINDWYETLKNGGVVVIAVGGRSMDFKEYHDDGKVTVAERLGDLNQRTGITSKNGHVITMVGIDDDGKIIFADSMYDVNNDDGIPQLDSRAYAKGLSLDEFYDRFGGNASTHIDSSNKTYVTIKNATITKVS